MKKFLSFSIFILLILLVVTYKSEITEFVLLEFVYKNDFNYVNENDYKKDTSYLYFNNTTNYKPENKKDILDIIYSSINRGYDDFNFYCQNSYKTCIDDVKSLTNDYEFLSNINNFVHPFNSYYKLNVSINSLGKISINVEKLYTQEMIDILNKEVDKIYNKLINNNMSDEEKIEAIHNYIINKTKYDQKKADDVSYGTNTSLYLSHTAYGPLIQGYGICSGYTDAMALFLDKMGIPNFRISSDTHIWNLVYINGKWLHLDLTFDDPVYSNGLQTVEKNYFLITTKELLDKEKEQHNFDQNIFMEAKN